MTFLTDLWRRRPSACVALVIGVLVALRMALVIASPAEIGPDEAQYWRWSQTLDFGYYSKPPLIAWVIALSTAVFGDSEWAIRLLSPVLHGIAAFFLYLLGKSAFEARVGAWAAAIYLLMPGVFLSSTIMSTDAVLLPASAGALYFLWRFRETPGLGNAALAGAFIGLAMLGKYAALYLYGGAALAALIDRDMRKALLSPAGAVLAAASLVVLGPNLWWNVANDFATVSHTADNANVGAIDVDPLRVFSYLQDQAAVFGPITLGVLIAGFFLVAGRKDKWTATREFWLMCFVVPPLLVIMAQEIMSRAHANWAASAYPGACALVAAWIDRAFGSATGKVKVGPFIKGGLAVNVVVGVLFSIVWVAPSLADAINASAAMKGVRGWKETTTQLVERARAENATAIMVDDRELWHGLDYYGRDLDMPPIRAWQRGPTPRSHAEEEGKIRPGEEDGAVLVASISESLRTMIWADFASMREIGEVVIPLTPRRDRKLKLYIASGYSQAPRTPEFEASHAAPRAEE